MSVNHTGMKMSDETKNKMSKSQSERQKLINTPSNLAKLTKSIVLQIREDWKTGKYSQIELARKYNVYKATISRIVNYKTWKYI